MSANTPPSTLGAARAVLSKELLLERRAPQTLVAMALFSATTYVLFHFALRRDTVDGNLAYHARLHGLRRPGERIEEVLAAVALDGRGDDRVHTFSRGMVQRLAVCRSILHEPDVLLLDEPRANLDPAATDLVEPLIGRSSGRTRVVTSHDPAGGLAEADLALGLRDGRAALLGPAAGVSADEIGALYR